jgi:hypothetical protein
VIGKFFRGISLSHNVQYGNELDEGAGPTMIKEYGYGVAALGEKSDKVDIESAQFVGNRDFEVWKCVEVCFMLLPRAFGEYSL